MKTCLICGATYSTTHKQGGKRYERSKYCSNKCRFEGLKKNFDFNRPDIHISGKFVELQIYGGKVLINAEYESWLSQFSWYVNDNGYAITTIKPDGIKKNIRMHRLVNQTPDALFTDHLNHNRLDNRRSNLRTVTQKENMGNYKGAKGYCWDASKSKWMVVHKKKFYGRYDTELEAQEAVKRARGGAEKEGRIHPRRKYLPQGVYYMLPMAQKNKPAYYIRPCIAGKKYFKGYFNTPVEARNAYETTINELRKLD